ncbi:MAG: hypothetical protein ACKPCP_38145, partial [Sphaerospermopsis kisseleviana]
PVHRESQPKPGIVPTVRSCIVEPRQTQRHQSGFFQQVIVCRAEFCGSEPSSRVCKIENRFGSIRDDSDARLKYHLWLESLTARYQNQGNVSGRGWRWLDDAPKPQQNSNQLTWSR